MIIQLYYKILQIKPRLDEFLSNMILKFSKNDTLKREIVLDPGPVAEDTICFTESIAAVDRNCIGTRVRFNIIKKMCYV